ncbi:MAG TPA: sugar ABC transporter permease [Caldilineae bacterium]|jgi:multiple sugar transport system permease protein|nr:sugar ABC transporter permease [Caldilineae bacterium]
MFYQRLSFEETFYGWLFILPAVLGLLLFSLGPVVISLILSFTKYDIISPPKWVGLVNYMKLPTDELWRKSVTVTLKYSVLSIPLSLIVAYAIAMLMSQDVKGISAYRTMWYLPSLVPSVASAALWRWGLNPEFGPINYPLKVMGLPAPGWLTDPKWIVPSLVIIHLWGLGNSALIFLAALKGVPDVLYEAAEVDGASAWHKFRHITIPMTSAVIFFQLIMGIIGSFQVFAAAYVLYGSAAASSSAGPQNAALFYVLYLYRNAFGYFRNGYACAMAWVLFVVIMILTWILFRSQEAWVYYEEEGTV